MDHFFSTHPEGLHSSPRTRLWCVIIAVAALFFHVALLHAQEPEQNRIGWKVEADKVETMYEAGIVEAEGNVTLSRENDYIKADFARYFRDTKWVFLRGDIEAFWEGDVLTAQEAEFDLQNRLGWLKEGSLFIEDAHLYMTAHFIRKKRGRAYEFNNVSLTACDADPPAWALTSDSGEITVDGYAKMYGTQLETFDLPIFYTPLAVVSAKTERQTGFLTPDAGFSTRLGLRVTQPFYWVIDEESDTTLFESFYDKRGFMHGFEFRRKPGPEHQGWWRFDFLHDWQVVHREANEGKPFNNDGLVRSNRDRFWWRSKYDAHLGESEWLIKFDIDWASDQNFLREFNIGNLGFSHSRDVFEEHFGRSIPEIDQDRVTNLLFTRSFEPGALALNFEVNQSVRHGHGNESESKDPSLRRLPEFKGFVFRDRLFNDIPLEYEFQGETSFFQRTHGTQGGRLDFRPKLVVPLYSDYGSFITELERRDTIYLVESHESLTTPESGETYPTRALWKFAAEADSEMHRVFDLNPPADVGSGMAWTKVKHSLQPGISYLHIPHTGQAQNPFYDEEDRIEPKHELTYSLTNVLTRRRELTNPEFGDPAKAESNDAVAPDYLDFLRLKLEQSYDFREATREAMRETYSRRPFSDLSAELEFSVDKHLSLISRTWFSPYLKTVTEQEYGLQLKDSDFGEISLNLDFQEDVDEYKRLDRENVNSAAVSLFTPSFYGLSLSMTYRRDLENERDLEKSMSLHYRHQCFEVIVSASQTDMEDRFDLSFNLYGIN